MSRQYADLYTWSHPYGEFAICHQDGASSVSIAWDGFDAEMLTTGENSIKWTELYTIIGLLGLEYCAEFHCWRESDSSLADEYLEHNSKIIRGREIAVAVREAMAAHLAPYGMTNRVLLVLTRLPHKRFAFGAKRQLIQQGAAADELLKAAKTLAAKLPGGRIQSVNEYAQSIVQSYNRAAYLRGAAVKLDPRFLISEQLLSEAPRLDGRLVSVGDQLTKVLLVSM